MIVQCKHDLQKHLSKAFQFIFSHVFENVKYLHVLGDVHLLHNADAAKKITMANVIFTESINTSECNDVFCKSLVSTAKNI